MPRPIRGNVYNLDEVRRQKDRAALEDVSHEIEFASEDVLALLQDWFGPELNEFVVACTLGKVMHAIGDAAFPGSSTAHLALESVVAEQLDGDIPSLLAIHGFLAGRRATARTPLILPLPDALKHYGRTLEAAAFADLPDFKTLAFRSRFSTVAVVLDLRRGEPILHLRECQGELGHQALTELRFLASPEKVQESPLFEYCDDDLAALGDEGYICTVRESCLPGQKTARLVVFNLVQLCFVRDMTGFLAILAGLGERRD
ncbi:MAG: hypothetical protein K0S16_134 [Moraxellaceae bacterium]|jgi:hypothetical protein|nr:hypothetical protein [Moraxellaceae bacterium]